MIQVYFLLTRIRIFLTNTRKKVKTQIPFYLNSKCFQLETIKSSHIIYLLFLVYQWHIIINELELIT